VHQLLKNISYSFLANLISLTVAVVMTLVVPKFISVYEYGIWQLFLFYFYYIGFFHLGWEDGIYLRYAGQRFSGLNRNVLSGQFYGIIFSQLLIAILLWVLAPCFIQNPVKVRVIRYTALLIPFVNFNNLCNFIMQISNRIKDYAKLLLTEQIVFFVLVLVFLLVLNYKSFIYLYSAKVISVACVSGLGVFLCNSILRASIPSLPAVLSEAKENISVGIKLMFANVAGMLIIGIVRYGISIGWDVGTFGKISLTLNISNFLLVFINAISIAFFPMLKQMDSHKLPALFSDIRSALTMVLFAALTLYYPLKTFLVWWLPHHADSLIYMAILFPICLFESKMQLLCTTYLKSMRQEALLLKINVISVVSSIMFTLFSVVVFHNLTLAVISILLLYAFRCFIAEYWLGQLLGGKANRHVAMEFVLVVLFTVTGWCINSWGCTAIYLAGYLLYLYINRCDVHYIICKIKQISKQSET